MTVLTLRFDDGSSLRLVSQCPRWYVVPEIGLEERDFGDNASVPCVFRTGEYADPTNYRTVVMTEPIQRFQADLLALQRYKRRLADLTKTEYADIARAFTSLYQSDRAFTNGSGFDCEKYPEKRANFIKNFGKGENLNMELPRFHPLICGGNMLTGKVQGEMLLIDCFQDVPSAPDLDDPRVLCAMVVFKDGSIGNFPQLGGRPVPYPFFGTEQYYALENLERIG